MKEVTRPITKKEEAENKNEAGNLLCKTDDLRRTEKLKN